MKAVRVALKRALVCLLSGAIVSATIPDEGGWAQTAPQTNTSPADHTSSSYTGQGVPLTTQELDALVSPIALYPDSLVAQILTAATFPDQIAIANYWLQQHKDLTGSALMQEVDKQTWDPSVKALTQFPSVLHNKQHQHAYTPFLLFIIHI